MKVDLVIRNARVVDHDGEFFGGVAIAGGSIVVTGADEAMPEARRVIDADGRVLMPGVIDPHCHLGVNYPYNEDMRTETAAAIAGGVTTVLLYIRNKSGPYVPFYKERRAVGEENASDRLRISLRHPKRRAHPRDPADRAGNRGAVVQVLFRI